jgi:hypothetical protein
MDDLQKLMDDIIEWSSKTFENETSVSKINHLKKEVEELRFSIFHEHSEEEKRYEFADCFMLLIAAAKMEGLTANDLILITKAKLELNKSRIWGKPDENGVVEHIENDEPFPGDNFSDDYYGR